MKSPRPWVAAILGLFDAPAGLLYAGNVRAFWTCWLVLLACYTVSAVVTATGKMHQIGFILIICMLCILRLSFPILSYRTALQSDGKSTKRWYQRWFTIAAMVVLGTLINESYVKLVRSNILEAFFVPGRAMSPTILHADRIFVDKIFGSAETLTRGELVVFRSASTGPLFVMRVIGLPGDTVEVIDETLRLNGQIVGEDYVKYAPSPFEMPDMAEMKVPGEHFFVLGDNRNFANDSRTLGPIPFEAYYGRPTNILWSRDYRVTEAQPGFPTFEIGPVLWNRLGQNITR